MHKSSMLRMKCFIENYVTGGKGKRILDVGSCSVNGSYKTLLSDIDIEYVGLDIESGPNVDVVMDKLYSWDSLQDESFDYVISGQAFEHIEYPWLTIREIYKKLKPDGIICIIAPNGLLEHRYPVDCYRYYADGLQAIAKWGGFEIIEVSVAGIPDESVFPDWDDIWNDVCLVACKSKDILDKFAGKKMFPIERRYNPTHNLKLQYEFVLKWKFYGDKVDSIIIDYIEKGQFDDVYVIGYEGVGIMLVDLLRSKGIDCKVIETKRRQVTEGCYLEIGAITDISVNENNEKNVLCILTIMDTHREWIVNAERQYHFSTVKYIDDIVREGIEFEIVEQMKELFHKCPDVYIYGAGVNGNRILEILKRHAFKISGFIVSDDRFQYDKNSSNILKLSEISTDSGIIISPNDDKAIKETLEKRNFNTVFDGKKFWA